MVLDERMKSGNLLITVAAGAARNRGGLQAFDMTAVLQTESSAVGSSKDGAHHKILVNRTAVMHVEIRFVGAVAA